MSWLRELVPVDAPVGEVAERLFLSGTHVGSVDRTGGAVSGVVVAAVLDVSDVPESDKLVVAQVDAGPRGTHQVLAGAKNFAKGDKVGYAIPGSRLTVGDIGVRRMLGKYESHGMLCSAKELGIADDHSGILVLDPDAEAGDDVAALLALEDAVLDLEIYPNRPDLLSILGIGREVALLFDVPLTLPDTSVVEDGPDASSMTSVTVDDTAGCPRYLARVIEDVRFGASPALVQARLTKCGLRPLGNLVDATNYVLWLTGQPLHAFDLDRLGEGRIVVRRARQDERITTLDGVDRALVAADLVIADASSAQAVAGVMGGSTSEVGPETTRVLLESAYFDPMTVARTARRLGLHTEAAARFERGADRNGVPGAAALCAELMRRRAGGRVARGAVDVGGDAPLRVVTLRHARTDALLGVHVEPAQSREWLSGLGCVVRDAGPTADVEVPSWRPDLEREVDLIEELARLYGYDAIPVTTRPGQRGFLTEGQMLRRRLREVMLGAGLSEAVLTSFAAEADFEIAGDRSLAVAVTNPMTADQGRLRQTLVPGLLKAARHNVAQGVTGIRLFEVGSVFTGWSPDAALPDEELRLGAVLAGETSADDWYAPPRPFDAYDAKGLVELVRAALGIATVELGPNEDMPFHPGRSATVVAGGVELGRFGEVRPSVREAMDLKGGAVLVELRLQPLLDLASTVLKIRDLQRFPPITRDIAAVVAEDVPAGEVLSHARDAAGGLVESAVVFDVYRGEPVPPGHKSLALRLTLRAPDRTLTSAEADEARSAVVVALRERFAADIR